MNINPTWPINQWRFNVVGAKDAWGGCWLIWNSTILCTHHGYEWWGLLQLSKELRQLDFEDPVFDCRTAQVFMNFLYTFFGVNLATLRYMSYILTYTNIGTVIQNLYMNSFAVVLVSCTNCFWNSHRIFALQVSVATRSRPGVRSPRRA